MKTVGMIFAAGLGTRLYPLTQTKPKALVEVGGVPMLERVIMRFKEAGITDIVVNVHHFAEQIRAFLNANDNFGLNINISDETDILRDTGGALVHARKYLAGADNIVIHNADILTDMSLTDMLAAHIESKADATLLVAERESSRYLYFNSEMRLEGWMNTKTGATLPPGFTVEESRSLRQLAFCGVHVISAGTLDKLADFSTGEVFSIINFYVCNAREMNFRGYMPSKTYQWFDIGSVEKLRNAEFRMQSSEL